MTPKPWYESITLWFNIVSAIVVIAGIFADPSLGFDPRIVAGATAVITVGNALIRVLRTGQPIAGSPADPAPPAPH